MAQETEPSFTGSVDQQLGDPYLPSKSNRLEREDGGNYPGRATQSPEASRL